MEEVGGVLGDLIHQLRDITRDNAENSTTDGLWSFDEWINYLNDGEREICRRALVLPATITLTLVASTSSYSISTKIIDIEGKGYCSYDQSYLTKVTQDWLNHNRTTWRTDTGVPTMYFTDLYNSTITLTPIPTSTEATYTVIILAKALPTTDLSLSNFTPSISSRYYEDMKLWALWRAYSKKDAETNDEKLALKYYQMFELSVGARTSANIERIMLEEPDTMRIVVRR